MQEDAFIRIKHQFIHRNLIQKEKLNNVDNLTLKSEIYQLRKTVKTPELLNSQNSNYRHHAGKITYWNKRNCYSGLMRLQKCFAVTSMEIEMSLPY